MVVVKVYSIISDITAGAVSLGVLSTEILSSGYVSNYSGVSTDGDSLSVLGDSLLDGPSLDSLVASHIVEPLSNLKTRRYGEVDLKTMELISTGATFDSVVFSLSPAAQINWNTLKNSEADFTWPVSISTLDNNEYVLTQANLSSFWTTGKNAVKGHLDSGRNIKKQIYDAADKAAVDLIIDNR